MCTAARRITNGNPARQEVRSRWEAAGYRKHTRRVNASARRCSPVREQRDVKRTHRGQARHEMQSVIVAARQKVEHGGQARNGPDITHRGKRFA